LRVVLDRWQLVQGLRRQVSDLQDQVREEVPEIDLRTQEPVMQAALDVAFQVAVSDATVLLRGESGTGKGVLARAIHARRPRAGRSSRSTALAYRRSCWRATCSVTCAARSPAPYRTRRVKWRPRRAGLCFSMRSANCR